MVIEMEADNDSLLFISANKNKLQYVQKLLDHLNIKAKCMEFPLYEFSIDDIFLIAAGKATEAYNKNQKPCIVMDTGFYIPSYPLEKDFPGSLIKERLLIPLGVDGLLEVMKNVKDRSCYFKECLVYYDGDELQPFYGIRRGTLLQEKRGVSTAEAWSELWSVFQPRNCDMTLAEMTEAMRHDKTDGHTEALEAFATWYQQKEKVKTLRKVGH